MRANTADTAPCEAVAEAVGVFTCWKRSHRVGGVRNLGLIVFQSQRDKMTMHGSEVVNPEEQTEEAGQHL